MRLLLFAAILLTTSMFAQSSFAAEGELRKCSFYEIMNDEDEDGLVQGSSGESVCYYLNKDTGAYAAQTEDDSVTRPTERTATSRRIVDAEQTPVEPKLQKKGYDYYKNQADTANSARSTRSTMQKARHDAMRASPPDNKSEVEVRGWDPEAKDALRKSQIPAPDGSSKE
jgi:hypothetical protein